MVSEEGLDNRPNELNLEGNIAEKWKRWLQMFELYLTASGIAAKSQSVKWAALLHVAGEAAVQRSEEADSKNYNKVKQRFQEFCEPKKNLTIERHRFFTRTQKPGETTDQYAPNLKNKSRTCEFGTLNDGLIKDRIVFGILSDCLRVQLSREHDLDLEKKLYRCVELQKSVHSN
uniref:Retrotransposon gag domain-containing protein n=1 Tax=Octopus bimaculoides TaxID=37653 RepID=A0A0L8IFU9_OCTBM